MKKEIKMEFHLTPTDHDSDDVVFTLDGKQVGFGYRSKKDQHIALMHCPKCYRENYALERANSGNCAFCGFNPNI